MIWQLVALLTVHWIADFVLQTHWQASNKSKNNVALVQHVLTYTCALFIAVPSIFFRVDLDAGAFVIVNGVLHFATDWCTSRVTSPLFIAQFDYIFSSFNGEPRMAMKRNFNPHNFFVVIGLDQLIHQITLAGTMVLFFGR